MAEFENVFVCLMTLFFCYHKRSSSIHHLFQKLSIFKTEGSSSESWDCHWHKTFSVTPVFTVLILLLFFRIIKILQFCGLSFTNFLFFLTVTNALATGWVNFLNTRMIVCFSYFWFDFPMVAWWKQTLHMCISEVE